MNAAPAGLGPLMVDVEGQGLTPSEIDRLRDPRVGGVILFSRNFRDREQLTDLVDHIHALRDPPLVVAVDQEGGRVQRLRAGFTRLPPPRVLGRIHDLDAHLGCSAARAFGEVLGSELAAVGIDVNFAPVVDVGDSNQRVIGNRAFHATPAAIVALAGALIEGMLAHGVGAVAKHYPGHGCAEGDTHTEAVRDERGLAEIQATDLEIYRNLIAASLPAVMTAHVTYPRVDAHPATFSRRWLHDVLRAELGFEGMVFSDDLIMHAARAGGSLSERVSRALEAGCDVVLACNEPGAVDALLCDPGLEWERFRPRPISGALVARSPGAPEPGLAQERLNECLALVDYADLLEPAT